MEELTDAQILAQIPAAREKAAREEEEEPRARSARYDPVSRRIHVELTNGCAFSFPILVSPTLRGASPEELEAVEVELEGEGLHWTTLDVDLLVPDLLRTVVGPKRWIREVARTMGRSRSRAKARASRNNGRKGGRPRKPK